MISHGQAPFLECSSKGEKRLSAFHARIKKRGDQTIEEIYQAAKVFEDGQTGLGWREAKGRKPINFKETAELYSILWDEYINENPDLQTLILNASGVSDRFGQEGHVCQATELWRIKQSLSIKQEAQMNTEPITQQINPDSAYLTNEELVSIFERVDDVVSPEANLSLFLRKFLASAMDEIKQKKNSQSAGICISEPYPIEQLEQATGLTFPSILKHNSFVFIDTETTGIDDDPASKLVEVAALKVSDGMITEFTTLINPGIPIPPIAASVHHITDEMVKNAPSEDDVRGPLAEFIGDSLKVAHNAKFDGAFINRLLGIPYSPDGAGTNDWLCTLRIARHALPGAERHNNQYLRYFFKTNPKTAGLGAHRAIDDTYVSIESLKCLCALPDIQMFKSLVDLKEWSDQPIPYPRMTYGKHGPNEDEGNPEGTLLSDVPLSYLEWLQKNDKSYQKNWDQRVAIDNELNRRQGNKLHAGNTQTTPEVPLTTMNFGKYNGRPISTIDVNYLTWCCENANLTDAMRSAIVADLQSRSKKLSESQSSPDQVRRPRPH